MTYCDVKSLKNCRLVSQKWNIEALNILSKKIRITVYNLAKNEDKVKRLISCLENSQNPEKLFVHFFTLSQIEHEHTWPDYFVDLLKKFGKYLKTFQTLYLIDCPLENGKRQWHQLLTDWAVNLTSIDIEVIPNPSIPTNKDADFGNIEFTQPLKLESMELRCGTRSNADFPLSFSTNCQMWLSSLFNSSPKLKRMDIAPYGRETEIVYNLVSPFPNTFENLAEFECEIVKKENPYYDDLEKILSAMKNLKKLTISSLGLLSRNAVCPPRSCFQGMKNSLKHLTFKDMSVFQTDDHHWLNCIEWFPNLEFFKMDIIDDENNWSEFDCSFKGLAVPHKNLKKLLLLKVKYEIINMESIRAIVKFFPNLEVLHLDADANGEDMLKVDEIMVELAQLVKLKELVMITIMNNQMQFTRGMQSIKHHTSLQNLTIGLYNKDPRFVYFRDQIFPCIILQNDTSLQDLSFTIDELKEPLLLAQRLRKLQLMGFNMEDENAVVDFARVNGIPLKIEELKEED